MGEDLGVSRLGLGHAQPTSLSSLAIPGGTFYRNGRSGCTRTAGVEMIQYWLSRGEIPRFSFSNVR